MAYAEIRRRSSRRPAGGTPCRRGGLPDKRLRIRRQKGIRKNAVAPDGDGRKVSRHPRRRSTLGARRFPLRESLDKERGVEEAVEDEAGEKREKTPAETDLFSWARIKDWAAFMKASSSACLFLPFPESDRRGSQRMKGNQMTRATETRAADLRALMCLRLCGWQCFAQCPVVRFKEMRQQGLARLPSSSTGPSAMSHRHRRIRLMGPAVERPGITTLCRVSTFKGRH